jgi:hypothetical protein
MALMYDYITSRTGVVVLEVLYEATLAEGVETFSDSRGVHQIPFTYLATDVRVQRLEFYFSLHHHQH